MKKVPTQGRSRQTVDALIEATARTIAERGWPATTTNHIAARAGVSVGSLYQYFRNKDALLLGLAYELEAAAPLRGVVLRELLAPLARG